MEFNINNTVKIKLTDRGREILRAQAEDLRKSFPNLRPYQPPQEDEEGYIRMQLWLVMETFGPYCGLGMQVPFETTIKIPDNT